MVNKPSRRPRKIDPTRTRLIRSKFETETRKRFRILKKEIQELLDGEDDLGLTVNAKWGFLPDFEKIKRFKDWLGSKVREVFGLRSSGGEGAWTDSYVEQSYDRGSNQAASAIQAKSNIPAIPGVTGSLHIPASADRVKTVQTRAFEAMTGVANHTTDKLSWILSEGIMRGDSPRDVARTISKEINSITRKRALTVARTETVRAHAEGSLDEMERLGVTEVGVDVEWSATKHLDGSFEARVCPLCRPLDGMILPIKKARGILPRHPNCRCAWTPAIEEDPKQAQAKERIRKSIKASLPKKKKRTLKEQISQENWKGTDAVQR